MPVSKDRRPRTIPKSFRIDESASLAVDKEAAAQNVSSNTLVNQILKQFAEFDRFARRINTVNLSSSIFRGLLTDADEERLIQLAKTGGSSIPQAFATTKTGKVTLESLLDHLRSLSMYAHLCDFSETMDTQGRMITLVHDYGLNWSIFLVHYVTSMFESIGVSPKVEMTDRSVTFSLTK